MVFRILIIIQILLFCSSLTRIYSQSKIKKENLSLQKKAHNYYKKGEFDKALADYRKIIKNNALNDIEFLQSYINCNEILANKEIFDEAVETCELVISILDERIQELETKEDKKNKDTKEIKDLKQTKIICENSLDDYLEKRLEQSKQKQREQEKLKEQNNYSANVKGYNFTDKSFVTQLLGLPQGKKRRKTKKDKKNCY